ncbi:MAG: hypothetical protein LDLANPLL_02054 [Turneriella sp.]|nr:hypothetical protein [Turneriella sp.]
MINKIPQFVFVVCVFLSTPYFLHAENNPPEIQEVTLELRTLSVSMAQKNLIQFLEKSDGYFVYQNPRSVAGYVPLNVSLETIFAAAAKEGYVRSRNVTNQNPTERINDLTLQLKAKEKQLSDVNKVLADSNLEETLEVEQELNNIRENIDALRGELQFLRERASLKKIIFYFESTGSAPQPRDYESFSWLDKMNIPSLIERFQ